VKRPGWVVLVLILIAIGAAWLLRDALPRHFGPAPSASEVSPAIADEAAVKLERLRDEHVEARLSADELNSLIEYRFAGWVPAVLQQPHVALVGDTVRLAGRVPTAELPELPQLERVRMLLPDTAEVEVAGRLGPLSPGRVAFEVAGVTVSGVPIPARFYPAVLARLGRSDEPGLAPTALPLTLPEGVASARVARDSLILTP
jgi:hypothetical protein